MQLVKKEANRQRDSTLGPPNEDLIIKSSETQSRGGFMATDELCLMNWTNEKANFCVCICGEQRRANKMGIICLYPTALGSADGALIYKAIVTDYVFADGSVPNMFRIAETGEKKIKLLQKIEDKKNLLGCENHLVTSV